MASDKLVIFIPGMGAVATTFIAGVSLIRQGVAPAIGSLTQLGHLPTPDGEVLIKDALDMPGLEDIVFAGWDIYEGNCYEQAVKSDVLNHVHMEAAKEDLAAISPMPAVFDNDFVRNLSGPNIKRGGTKMDYAQALMEDIDRTLAQHGATRGVAVWCGSTEAYVTLGEVHLSLEAFEQGLRDDDPGISPSMIYAYALLKKGIPYSNGAPNMTVDVPAIVELARTQGLPISGKDFKTGQTLMKTILAPGFAARLIGVEGWYSTNILGNTDGHVLDDPASFKSKEKTKLSVLQSILDEDKYPDLYKDMHHKVRIDYYPPRGDNKEGWDNIDIVGWLGYPMQIKINFLCRDSILAAPIVLDLALFMDLAHRKGNTGIQKWLSFYFKSPQVASGEIPEHDLFEQLEDLQAELAKHL